MTRASLLDRHHLTDNIMIGRIVIDRRAQIVLRTSYAMAHPHANVGDFEPMLFKSLPVLDKIIQKVRVEPQVAAVFSRVVFVFVQHLLESTGSLIEALATLGGRTDKMFVLGKSYSANVDVMERLRSIGVSVQVNSIPNPGTPFSEAFENDVHKLWELVIRGLPRRGYPIVVIVDDGGHCIKLLPKGLLGRCAVICGVEQTKSGLHRLAIEKPRIPVIDVAFSAAKKFIEAPMIADAIISRLPASSFTAGTKCGVIGLGNVGRALARRLLESGHMVYATDRNRDCSSSVGDTTWCKDVREVLRMSECIFGCTGEDVMTVKDLTGLTGNKVLVSCSSEDREFYSLLARLPKSGQIAKNGKARDIAFNEQRLQVTILNGGYPINFDKSTESVPSTDIQTTRGLLLGGILQSLFGVHRSANVTEQLDPALQQFVVQAWFQLYPSRALSYPTEIINGFKDSRWIGRNSAGTKVSIKLFDSLGSPPLLENLRG
jgi:S-adenosylhomocysteine hydrolase